MFGVVLRALLPFYFENQIDSADAFYNEIWNVLPPRPIPKVVDLKSQVIVLDIGNHFFRFLKNPCGVSFPPGISNNVADMRFRRNQIWSRGLTRPHVPGAPYGVVFIIYWFKGRPVLLLQVLTDVLDDDVDI